MDNDIDVIRRIKNGETEVFSFLVEKYHHRVLGFIHRLVGDHSIVEDLGQDIFLNVYKSLGEFDEQAGVPFSAWLFIIARNRALGELRKQRGLTIIGLKESDNYFDPGLTGVDLLVEREQRQALQDCLAQLPEPYKNAIMRSLRGDSIKEIAELENVSPGTVKSRLFRARNKLKHLLRNFFRGKNNEQI